MIDIVYFLFFWVLAGSTAVFVLLNVPTPRGFKGKLVQFLCTNKLVSYIMYGYIGLCALALFFYFDLAEEEAHFMHEKDRLKGAVDRHAGTELRIGFLSYSVLKIQRNKYITFMMIYASIALNVFVLLLRHIYKQREDLEKAGIQPRRNSDKLESENLPRIRLAKKSQ